MTAARAARAAEKPPGGTGAGETVVYGKQEEDAPQDGGHGEGEPELDIPAEDGSPVTSDALEAKKREFRKLIGGEYKDLYQQEVSRALDQRFRKNRGLEAKLGGIPAPDRPDDGPVRRGKRRPGPAAAGH